MDKTSLEDKLLSEKRDFTHREALGLLSSHPLLLSLTGAGLIYIGNKQVDAVANLILPESVVSDFNNANNLLGSLVLPTCGVYTILRVIHDYVLDKGRITHISGENLTDKIKNWTAKNPLIISSAVGLSEITSLLGLINKNNEMRQLVAEFVLFIAPISFMITDIQVKGIENIRRIKKSVKRMNLGITEKIYNQLYEHPILIASGAGLTKFVYDVNDIFIPRVFAGDKFLIESYPLWMVIAFIFALNTGLKFGTATTIGGTLLHSHSLRLGTSKLKGLYYKLTDENLKSIQEKEKQVLLPDSIDNTIERLVTLGRMYESNERHDDAFNCYSKALRMFDKKDDAESYSSYFSKLAFLSKIKRFWSSFKLKEGNLDDIFIALLNKDNRAIKVLRKKVLEDPQNNEIRYLYGKALQITGFKELGNNHKIEAIKSAFDSKPDTEEIKGGKNKVVVVKSGFMKTEIVKKYGKLDDLTAEMNRTFQAIEILKQFNSYYAPLPIGLTEDQKCYLMERSLCDFLDKRIIEGRATLEDFVMAADYAALMNAKIKGDIAPERDVKKTIQERIFELVDNKIFSFVMDGIEPALASLESIPRVYNKDPRPANIGIYPGFGDIIGIDFEGGRYVPITFNIADLFGDHSFLNWDSRLNIVQDYRKSFLFYGGKNYSEKDHLLAFYNSIILRSLETYGQIIPEEKYRRTNWLLNSKQAVEFIKEDFYDYYSLNKRQYGMLIDAIDGLL